MKILGHLIIIDVPENTHNYYITKDGNISNGDVIINVGGKLLDRFKVIGTVNEIITNPTSELIDNILINHYIDYNDLNKDYVNPLKSFKSFRTHYNVSEASLFLTYAEYQKGYINVSTLPKSALNKPHASALLKQIDKTKQKYIVDKNNLPKNFNGFYLYDLSNFEIIPDIFYCIKSNGNHILRNTSIDINVQNVSGAKRKQHLYNNIIKERIIILN